jgi:hypothetical protein
MAKKRQNIDLNKQAEEAKALLRQIEEKRAASKTLLEETVPAAKAAAAECYYRLDDIGVAEDYEASVLRVAAHFDKLGVPLRLPWLRKVQLDQVRLDEARKALGDKPYNDADEGGKQVQKAGKGYITETPEGNTVILSLTEAGRAAVGATTK